MHVQIGDVDKMKLSIYLKQEKLSWEGVSGGSGMWGCGDSQSESHKLNEMKLSG